MSKEGVSPRLLLGWLQLLALALLLLGSTAQDTTTTTDTPIIHIDAVDYCNGCRAAVVSYAKNLHDASVKTKRKSQTEKKFVNSNEVLAKLCISPEMAQYHDATYHSCMNLLTGNFDDIAEAFNGRMKAHNLNNKKFVYGKEKEICLKAAACPAGEFDNDAVIGKKRNKCAACSVIATDFDRARQMRITTLSLPPLLDDFCDSLGYQHQPYSWLETLCDEMAEDFGQKMLQAVGVFESGESTQMPPRTLAQLLCADVYGCDDNFEVVKDVTLRHCSCVSAIALSW
eukprot:CAMPEP_0173221066 /NCGR_PEP_ID=MMETSP1142-20121109/2518_1 /TAXON_ID=483371 /ORGANISM="non described non described, Strain CCMP2298" /LENGTH=284 /DNA_ID=CAMNT_0014149063 /DNA_START=60 /DNA_END=911 /DNA_ORIENTATION=-